MAEARLRITSVTIWVGLLLAAVLSGWLGITNLVQTDDGPPSVTQAMSDGRVAVPIDMPPGTIVTGQSNLFLGEIEVWTIELHDEDTGLLVAEVCVVVDAVREVSCPHNGSYETSIERDPGIGVAPARVSFVKDHPAIENHFEHVLFTTDPALLSWT